MASKRKYPRTITLDPETGVLHAKLFYRIDGEDPDKLHVINTEIIAYELTDFKMHLPDNSCSKVAAYLIPGLSRARAKFGDICHANTTDEEYLSYPIITLDFDYMNDKKKLAAIVSKYNKIKSKGPITEAHRKELNEMFANSTKLDELMLGFSETMKRIGKKGETKKATTKKVATDRKTPTTRKSSKTAKSVKCIKLA